MEQLPKIVRERLAAAPPGVHPDPDVLTAFVESSLSERERTGVLDHLAKCQECRETVTLSAPQRELEMVAAATAGERRLVAMPAAVEAARQAPARSSWFRLPVLRWAAVTAGVVVVGAAVLVYRQSGEKMVALDSRQAAAKVAPGVAVAKLEPEQKQGPPAASAQNEADQQQQQEEMADRLSASAVSTDQKRKAMSRDLSLSAANRPARADASPSLRQKSQQIRRYDTLAAGSLSASGGARASSPAANALSAEMQTPGSLKKDESASSGAKPLPAAPPPPPSEVSVSTAPTAPVPAPETAKAESKSEALAKAKSTPQVAATGGGFAGVAEYSKERNLDLMRAASNVLTPRWVLSNDGKMLLRSTDEGKTWTTISVAEHIVLLSVNAFGSQVWAGGSGGALYHSTDEGAHWVQVKPVADGKSLADDVTEIHFSDLQHGQLTTLHHQVWTTSDGGQTWLTQ